MRFYFQNSRPWMKSWFYEIHAFHDCVFTDQWSTPYIYFNAVPKQQSINNCHFWISIRNHDIKKSHVSPKKVVTSLFCLWHYCLSFYSLVAFFESTIFVFRTHAAIFWKIHSDLMYIYKWMQFRSKKIKIIAIVIINCLLFLYHLIMFQLSPTLSPLIQFAVIFNVRLYLLISIFLTIFKFGFFFKFRDFDKMMMRWWWWQ